MTALAYAAGTRYGRPYLADRAGGLGYPLPRPAWTPLRATRVADYLLQSSTEAGGRLIRLFHQALVDQLRRHRDGRSDQDAITTALSWRVDAAVGPNTASYTLGHLAAHAGAAGRIGTAHSSTPTSS